MKKRTKVIAKMRIMTAMIMIMITGKATDIKKGRKTRMRKMTKKISPKVARRRLQRKEEKVINKSANSNEIKQINLFLFL